MSNGENQTPEPTTSGAAAKTEPTTLAPTTLKAEMKDGHVLVDGKKMVPESDLMALKQSSESALERAQAAHNEAIDAKGLELSAAQQQAADLNAKLTEAQQAREAGATSGEEVARIKTELTDALGKVETLTTEAGKALELRRELMVTKYSISADSLANKSMVELDSFEEALKALATSRGSSPGPYAVGGGLGGAAKMTEQERAAQVIANTPIRGVRNAEPATK